MHVNVCHTCVDRFIKETGLLKTFFFFLENGQRESEQQVRAAPAVFF